MHPGLLVAVPRPTLCRQQSVPRAEALMQDCTDRPTDLADASFLILAGHPGHGRIPATDGRDTRAHCGEPHAPLKDLL